MGNYIPLRPHDNRIISHFTGPPHVRPACTCGCDYAHQLAHISGCCHVGGAPHHKCTWPSLWPSHTLIKCPGRHHTPLQDIKDKCDTCDPGVALLTRTSINKTKRHHAVVMTFCVLHTCGFALALVGMSSGARVSEASVQVYQCDVAYDDPSSRLTVWQLKANNKRKL